MSSRMIGANALRVAVGAGVSGVSSVVVLGLAARAFPGADFTGFSSWWTVAILCGLVFTVLETYLPNAQTAATMLGGRAMDGTAVVARRGAFGVVVVGGAVLATAPWSAHSLFHGQVWLPVLLVLEVVLLAAQSIQRGAAVATGEFRTVTAQQGVDGVSRIACCLVAWALGIASPVTFIGLILLSATLGLVAGRLAGGRFVFWHTHELKLPWRPMFSLFVAGVGPTVIMNVPTPWLVAHHELNPYVVGGYVGATALSRVPAMFAGALYGPVLNPLLAARSRQDRETFRRILWRAAAGAVLLGAGLVAGATFLGELLVRFLVGPDYQVSPFLTGLLMCAGAQVLLTGVLSAGLAAAAAWNGILWAWTSGMAVLTVVLLVGFEPVTAATAAPLLGVSVATGTMAVFLWHRLKDGDTFSDSVPTSIDVGRPTQG